MSRTKPWRHALSDVACASQAFAASATMYILRQTGPTGFLLKEEGETKDFKVYLGDPHSCTCLQFRRDKDLCKHICWILLKRFRISKDDPLSWQLGLVEREINEVLRGPVNAHQAQVRNHLAQKKQQQLVDAAGGRSLVEQREISNDDVCPICQDELLEKKLPVTFCRFGCGNSVHIKCMKVWAEHQLKVSPDLSIKCPMCREDFGPISLLKQELHNARNQKFVPGSDSNTNHSYRHIGLGCSNCRCTPIEGKCYRCCTCEDFYLCQVCFNTPVHTQHSFQFRQKRNQQWRSAQRTLGAVLPDGIVSDLMTRELSESDYDMLLQLDNHATAPFSDLTEEALHALPMERVSHTGSLLAPGSQCRVCLRGFHPGQYVRKLPCHHKFHKDCIDNWLLHSHPTCPIDGFIVFTSQPSLTQAGRRPKRSSYQSSDSAGERSGARANRIQGEVRSLSVPNLGIIATRFGSSDQNEHGQGEGRMSLQHPLKEAHHPHQPPSHLVLNGIRLGNEHADISSSLYDSLLPGNRLLHQALRRRTQINEQLTHLMLNTVHQPATDDILSSSQANNHCNEQSSGSICDKIHLQVVATRPRAEQGRRDSSDLIELSHNLDSAASAPGLRKGRQRQDGNSFQRPASLRQHMHIDKTALPPSSTFQNLFLGNDPRLNRPLRGEVAVTHGNLQAGKHSSLHHQARIKQKHSNSSELDIVLEGSRLEQFKLKDIL